MRVVYHIMERRSQRSHHNKFIVIPPKVVEVFWMVSSLGPAISAYARGGEMQRLTDL
jgi:hypothetical protein